MSTKKLTPSQIEELQGHTDFAKTHKEAIKLGLSKGYTLKELCKIFRDGGIPLKWSFFEQAAKEALI